MIASRAVPQTFVTGNRPMTVRQSRGQAVRRVVAQSSGQINPDIQKDEAKVVHTCDVSEQDKKQVAYCRCWRSSTFPMCDGSHMKHNEATGDNVGPLLVKK